MESGEGLVSPWVGAALLFGLVYHFTPSARVREHACRLFRKLPGFVVALLFVGLACGLMLLMQGSRGRSSTSSSGGFGLACVRWPFAE